MIRFMMILGISALLATSSTRSLAAKSIAANDVQASKEKFVAKNTSQRATFTVGGMHCVNCSKGLTHALQSLKGVRSANVNLATKRASVVFDPKQQSVQKLRTFITQAGFKATPIKLKGRTT